MSEKSTQPTLDTKNATTKQVNPEVLPLQEQPPKKKSNKLLWFIVTVQFIIMLGISGAGLYLYQTLNQLFVINQSNQTNQASAYKQDVAQLKQALDNVNNKVNQISDSALSKLNNELNQTLARFKDFEQSVARINDRLTKLSPRDEQQWMISQIEYFIKMAQYRINLTGDNQGAALLLDQASVVAAQLRSPDASALLTALSQDRAKIKIDGHWQPELIHAQLNALIEQIPNLTVAAYSRKDFDTLAEPSSFSQAGFGKILTQLVRVQSTDNAVKPLLDQTTRKQVEQHMFMLLTEGQLNVMRQNQEGYESALKQLNALVHEAFSSKQKETAFFLEEIQRLQKIQVSRPTTTLDSSEQALRNLVQLFEKKNG